MNSQISQIETSKVIPGNNDRTIFNREALDELASSIKTYGLAQPITVRPMEQCTECGALFTANDAPEFCPGCGNDAFDATYQIVAGERRFRAVKDILGLDTIPAIIRNLDDEQASAIMLAENVARADLDPIDEGRAYQYRMDTYGWTAKDCAEKAGVSTVRVHFRIKLLRLRDDVQKLVRDEQLPLGYAQVLADGDLDINRQLIALSSLRDNPSPTPTWFRKVVGQLVQEQSQESLFDTDAFFVAQEVESDTFQFSEPPHPSTATPPSKGKSLRDIIAGQVDFWKQAAIDWNELGKPFKRQECEAAAQALSLVLSSVAV